MTDRLFRELIGPILPLPGQDEVPKQYRQSAPAPIGSQSSEAEVPPITVAATPYTTQGVNSHGIPE